MADNIPLVSIFCITYNQAPYLRKCLDGFVNQKTEFPIEILLYDDASTDETQDIVSEYVEKYPFIFNPLLNTKNQYQRGIRGMNMKFNFPRSRGKYLAFCEGDDFWTDPYKLQKQVDFLEKNPDFSICCTNYSEVDKDEQILKATAWNGFKLSPIISHEMILEQYKPKILTSIFRKKALEREFPDIFFSTFNTDNFLCAIATEYGPAGFLNFNSGCYRVHSQGIWSGIKLIGQYENQLDSFSKMKEYFTKPNQQKSIEKRIYKIRRGLCKAFFTEKRFKEGFVQLRLLSRANKVDSLKVLVSSFVSLMRK